MVFQGKTDDYFRSRCMQFLIIGFRYVWLNFSPISAIPFLKFSPSLWFQKIFRNNFRNLNLVISWQLVILMSQGNSAFCYWWINLYVIEEAISIMLREDKGKERIPHTWASSVENYLKSIFGSVSYCLVILRTTPHWSVRLTSCNSRLLTWEQQLKITFAAWVRTKTKFQIRYRIYSIKRRPRINAALDKTPQMEAKLPINAAPNQKNAAFIRGLKEKKITRKVKLGKYTWTLYISQARQLWFYLSKKARHWNFKHVSVLHSIYEWFTVIIISDLRNMILK